MAEIFKDYFTSVFTVEDNYKTQEINPAQPSLIPLSDCDLTEDAVTKALDEIKTSKTPGPDCIAPTFLKEASIKSTLQ